MTSYARSKMRHPKLENPKRVHVLLLVRAGDESSSERAGGGYTPAGVE